MGRNNKKIGEISAEKAKDLIREAFTKIATPEHPLVYVGDILEDNHWGYLIAATPYKQGDKPEENYIRVFVDRHSGELSLAHDLIG